MFGRHPLKGKFLFNYQGLIYRDLSIIGGEGGIRTHVTLLSIRFRVGAVMTASVPLRVRRRILPSGSFSLGNRTLFGGREADGSGDQNVETCSEPDDDGGRQILVPREKILNRLIEGFARRRACDQWGPRREDEHPVGVAG